LALFAEGFARLRVTGAMRRGIIFLAPGLFYLRATSHSALGRYGL
jgi:hypothetical protein